MLGLHNASLRVDLLDPAADAARLGARFCWGGFVWQVHDAEAGPLFTGPEWPKPEPAPHNGQGLPESFRHRTTTGEPLLWDGPVGLAPGGGKLELDASGTASVSEPCRWSIDRSDRRISFCTQQTVGRWSYALRREVELRERELISRSELTNLAQVPMGLEWFAHPFFALRDGKLEVTLPSGTSLPANPGFLVSNGKLSLQRAFAGEKDGHLDHLQLPVGAPLAARLSHPRLAYLDFETSFVPFKCVVWANGNTLSLEPFLRLDLAPGESRRWHLTYRFGPVR